MTYEKWVATVERGVTITPEMAFAAGATSRDAEVAEAYHSGLKVGITSGEASRDAEIEELITVLEKISDWAKAYPLSVFPEPDFKKANEVLKAAGMTLDAISASNMRHVIVQAQKIVDAALAKVRKA